MSILRDTFDGQFDHTWQHVFEEPGTDRSAWLTETLQMAQDAGIALIHRDTDYGFEFAFYSKEDWMAFALNITAAANGIGDHTHTQFFDNIIMQKNWTALAHTYLDQADIDYQVTTTEGQAKFHFQKLADRLVLNQLVDSGILDEGANILNQIRILQNRIADIGGPNNSL